MSIRKSGLQKEVLALYRRALRLVPTKPVAAQHKFTLFIRYSFRKNADTISPRDYNAIEHLLRQGQRQVEQLENVSVRDCWVGDDMRAWAELNPGRRV